MFGDWSASTKNETQKTKHFLLYIRGCHYCMNTLIDHFQLFADLDKLLQGKFEILS